MSVEYVDCRAEQLPALQDFFALGYSPDYVLRRNVAHFKWQYGDTPASKAHDYHMKLALVDGHIKACLGYVPIEVSVGGRIAPGCWLANWMVDPDQRQFGLGLLIMRQLLREFEFPLIIGPNPIARNLLTRMGWTDLGEVARYIYVLDAKAAGGLTESGSLEWPIKGERKIEAHPGVTTQSVMRFSEDATRLWDDFCGEHMAGGRRTAAYLNWRYADHATFDYRMFEARQNGRLIGLTAYRLEQARDTTVKIGRICELIAEQGMEGNVLKAVLDDAQSRGVAVADFVCSSKRFESIMPQYGFVPSTGPAGEQIPLLFQPIDRKKTSIPYMAYCANIPDADRIEDWYFTKGDADNDRPN